MVLVILFHAGDFCRGGGEASQSSAVLHKGSEAETARRTHYVCAVGLTDDVGPESPRVEALDELVLLDFGLEGPYACQAKHMQGILLGELEIQRHGRRDGSRGTAHLRCH